MFNFLELTGNFLNAATSAAVEAGLGPSPPFTSPFLFAAGLASGPRGASLFREEAELIPLEYLTRDDDDDEGADDENEEGGVEEEVRSPLPCVFPVAELLPVQPPPRPGEQDSPVLPCHRSNRRFSNAACNSDTDMEGIARVQQEYAVRCIGKGGERDKEYP